MRLLKGSRARFVAVRPVYRLLAGTVDITTVDGARQLIVTASTPTIITTATLTVSQSAIVRGRELIDRHASAFRDACMIPPAARRQELG
jgi:hypothetical protein